MASKITPISGFPEYLPAQQLAFNGIADKIRRVYESFGYVPLETPAVERIDTLISKGIDSKEVYALRRLNVQGDDDGSKDLALRFDLTVPLARYVSQHYANLIFPFRRYQVQPVWRGERPKKGRERQFYQFDLDYIGENTLPLAADAEVIAAAHQALSAMGLKFTMRVNNRQLLQAMVKKAGYPEYEAIKLIDNLEKISEAEAVTQLNALNSKTDAKAFLKSLKSGKVDGSFAGADDLQKVVTQAREMTGADNINIDLTIARGLDYYTGTVIETMLVDAPEFGSICSGGRYDNLAESLSDRKLPGVGVSIGITRLFEWMESQPQFAPTRASTAQVIVALQKDEELGQMTEVASALRTAGIAVEQNLQPQPLGTQLQKAQKRGLTHAVIAAEDGSLTLRPFETRQDVKSLNIKDIIKHLSK